MRRHIRWYRALRKQAGWSRRLALLHMIKTHIDDLRMWVRP